MSPPGMMALFRVVLWSALPPLVLLSGSDPCNPREIHSRQNTSSELDSLQCYNDYKSFVLCKWREGPHVGSQLQLWFQSKNSRERCEPLGAPVWGPDGHRTVQCRYQTNVFSIGISHTAFFDENRTLCSPVHHKSLDVSRHLRARPPPAPSARKAADGSWCVQWSGPYPASSPLNRNLTYQLSYSSDGGDKWTREETSSPRVKLEKQLLLPGRRYEARVRCRAAVGQWSPWSPTVSWRTEEDAGHFPSVHCMLDGERELTCGWEVSRELDRFITYELACQRNHAAPSERCCPSPAVTSDPSGTVLWYNCLLTGVDPARLLLQLLPTRKVKTFEASKHIRPNPPPKVEVQERGNYWLVKWTEPTTKFPLHYQVCYYRTQDEGSPILQCVKEGTMSYRIPGESLTPLEKHRVKVRSLVAPGEGSLYEGTPSEWSDPVEWTSHAAPWSLATLIYILIGVCVAVVFLTLYCTIPACQRKVILWVESVPSPGKSKTLSDLKSAANWNLMQSEDTSVCTVQSPDSLSTCSTNSSLWLTKDSEEKDKACWDGDNPPAGVDEANDSGNSSLRFSGPYIFCKGPFHQLKEEIGKKVPVYLLERRPLRCIFSSIAAISFRHFPPSADRKSSEPTSVPAGTKLKEPQKEEVPPDGSTPPPALILASIGDGYVCLPGRSVSRSEQDLAVSRSCDANANTGGHEGPERPGDNERGADKPDAQPDLAAHEPPPCASWPAVKASGYCLLPTAAH